MICFISFNNQMSQHFLIHQTRDIVLTQLEIKCNYKYLWIKAYLKNYFTSKVGQ